MGKESNTEERQGEGTATPKVWKSRKDHIYLLKNHIYIIQKCAHVTHTV